MAIKLESTVQLFDREAANSVLRTMQYKHQRAITQLRVSVLRTAMEEDTFSPVNMIAYCQVGADNVCINGYHTLTSIVATGKTYQLPVTQYYCDTEDERAALYFHFDRQGRRNIGDSVRALEMPEKIGLNSTQIRCTVTALRYIKGGWGINRNAYAMISDDRLLGQVPFWVNQVHDIYAAISPCSNVERNLIVKRPVFCVALITMRYQPAKASDFWRQIAQDDGLERYDPRKIIRTWLQKHSMKQDGVTPEPETEVSRAVILAWNAWWENRTLRYTLVRDNTKTVRICGTPFNGNQPTDYLPEWSEFQISNTKQAA